MKEEQDIKYKVETLRQFAKEHPEVFPDLHHLDDPEIGKRMWRTVERLYRERPLRELEPIVKLVPKLFSGSGRPDLHDLLLTILKKTYDMGTDMENMPVVQSNQLIMAQYKLSKLAQQTLRTLISMVKPDQTHFVGQMYRLKVQDMGRLLNRDDSSNLYKELQEVAQDLLKTTIVIKNGDEVLVTTWIQAYRYYKGDGVIDFQFSYLLDRYLLQLKQSFTEYRLENIPRLKHKHTIRIYELLRQYLSIGVREISVDDLKEMLKVENYAYPNLRQSILEPAHEEINSLTDIRYDWEAVVGTRKRIGKIRFINIRSVMPVAPAPQAPVQQEQPKQVPWVEEEDELTPKIAEIMADPENEIYKKCLKILKESVLKNSIISPDSPIFGVTLRGHIRTELKSREYIDSPPIQGC